MRLNALMKAATGSGASRSEPAGDARITVTPALVTRNAGFFSVNGSGGQLLHLIHMLENFKYCWCYVFLCGFRLNVMQLG